MSSFQGYSTNTRLRADTDGLPTLLKGKHFKKRRVGGNVSCCRFG